MERIHALSAEIGALETQTSALSMELLALVTPFLKDKKTCEQLLDILPMGHVRFRVRVALEHMKD